MTIRSRRSALRFESLEQRALLAVVVSPADQMESVEPVEQLEPVEQFECVELIEQFEQCRDELFCNITVYDLLFVQHQHMSDIHEYICIGNATVGTH